MYKQYFHFANIFGFHDSPDSVYRFVQGALLTCKFELTIVAQIWLNFEQVEQTFPENGDKIRGLILMVKDRQGSILDEYGIPVVAMLEDHLESRRFSPPLPRLLGNVETKGDFFHAITYRKEQPQDGTLTSTQNVIKSIKKQHFLEYTFDDILATTADNVKTTRTQAISAFLEELNSITTIYQQNGDHISAYGLGKMLMPGRGLRSFILQASGSPEARHLHGNIFAVAKHARAAVICLGIPQLNRQKLVTILNKAFRGHQLVVYDLFEMISASLQTGN